MNLTYHDENQQEHPVVMGCYGIGVTRTFAAIVEQHHDENGIIWPVSVAPYHVIITVIRPSDGVQASLAGSIAAHLEAAGCEVIIDDRDERPGVKFKDADLLGIPVRITVGKKAADGIVEYKLRQDGEVRELPAQDAAAEAIELINAEK